MKLNITIEIDDEELKELFNLKSEDEKYPRNRIEDRKDASQYARVFDDSCKGWRKDPEYNLSYLIEKQEYANGLLKSRGNLLLNDVYDMLGIPRSKAGTMVGWHYDDEHSLGNNRVNFGIYNKCNSDFINGYISTVLLDFNVDEDVFDLI